MLEIDQWILVRAEQLVERSRGFYEEFGFHRAYQALYNFCTIDLSALYFDVLKDRLYTAAPQSRARRSAQTALYRLTDALVRLLAPLVSYTAEEAWKHFTANLAAPKSVHLAEFPAPSELTSGLTAEHRARAANWERLVEVRDSVLKSLEIARQEKFIGAPLEARVTLTADDTLFPLLDAYQSQLPMLFIVSQVKIKRRKDITLAVDIERADGSKCERCWKYATTIGADPRLPTICAPCAEAVAEIAGA
jgi:isoleucyl-tRNA synthetase